MAIQVEYWPIVDKFIMVSQWSFSNHIILVVSFEKLQISIGFISNSKNTNYSQITLSWLQILKILNLISSHTKPLEKSPNFKGLAQSLWELWIPLELWTLRKSLEHMIIALPGETG